MKKEEKVTEDKRSVLEILANNYAEFYWSVAIILIMQYLFLKRLNIDDQMMVIIEYFYCIELFAVYIKCMVKHLNNFDKDDFKSIKWYHIIIGLISFVLQAILFASSAILAVKVLLITLGLI